jgi:regulator of protease activity HflC (stomatin/prohibitin superfamily)
MVVPSQTEAVQPESVQAYFNKMYQQLEAQAQAQAQQRYAEQQTEAETMLAEQYKQTLGNLIYAKVEPKLADMMKSASYSDETEEAMVWPSNMTAGKIVGMFLEAMELVELRSLINDEAYFEKNFNDAIGILHEHWEKFAEPSFAQVAC